MKFLLPQGIGDSVWALHKLRSAARALKVDPIDVFLNCSENTPVQVRAREFVSRFDFVRNVDMAVCGIHPYEKDEVDKDGRYNYIADGPTWFAPEVYALMPNGPLERGIRLEDWLPEFPIEWDTPQHFQFRPAEELIARNLQSSIGEKYCVFFLGSLPGNTRNGHNRGPRWTPEEWVTLGARIEDELGYKIVVVGAEYDEAYWYIMVKPILDMGNRKWYSLIGQLGIGETFAVVKHAQFVIAYQSGIGIFGNYLGVPAGIFWRAAGDSISPDLYLSFDERMASAWANPDTIAAGKHLPLIYGRHNVSYIMSEIKNRGW